MKKIYLLFVAVVAFSCSSGKKSDETAQEWIGTWKAEWETPPESPSYAGIVDMEFYMDGMFVFTEDSLTVQNNGYPGCIFADDTLKHTQLWRVSEGTLSTFNSLDNPGMTYQIKSIEENRIKLQLMEDIFVTLSK